MDTLPEIQASTQSEFAVIGPERKVKTNTICGAWCFILGLASPDGGSPSCSLLPGHKGDHTMTVQSFVEPKATFIISWSLDNG